ncbi:conserved hypothetical protein [Ricinus communis]|uniref:Uncharacterized protein n=1 Tax=Ricinus communis TaxID=3988 RepID=B9THU7_RICCO|nr:conserved hypothetical protein [Ricinus communis]
MPIADEDVLFDEDCPPLSQVSRPILCVASTVASFRRANRQQIQRYFMKISAQRWRHDRLLGQCEAMASVRDTTRPWRRTDPGRA